MSLPHDLSINRSRTDTGDFTRNSTFTGTTQNSRHRRSNDHFSFCSASISEIYNKKGTTSSKKPPPPSVVSFQERPGDATSNGTDGALARPSALNMADRGASDVSALGFGDSLDHYQPQEDAAPMYGDLLGLGYDDEHNDDDDSGSPFAALKKNADSQTIPATDVVEDTDSVQASYELEYLRKNRPLDDAAEGTLIISGWVALLNLGEAMNNHQHHHYRIPSNHQFEADDIYYLRATKDSSGKAFLRLRPSNDSTEHTLTVNRDWTIESREVNGRMGKAVILRTPKASLLLLPVSLDDRFFAKSGDRVSSSSFDALREELFVPQGHYAPDQQMDAAMYLMFTVDSLVKQCGSAY